MSMLMRDAIAQTNTAINADGGPVPYELSGQKMLTDTLVFLALLFGIFYFILIRPQQRRLKEHTKMLDSIKKGSHVVTGGGILGTVVKADEEILTVEIAPNVKVKVARNSVGEVLEGKHAHAETANDN